MNITPGTRRSLVVLECLDETAVAPGEVVCLVRNIDTNCGESYWTLDRDPRTNVTNETRWDGWLGATGAHSRHAHGAYRVVSSQPHTTAVYARVSAVEWLVVSLVKVDDA